MFSYTIDSSDLEGKGVVGLSDTPRLTTEQMQAKLDEIATDVIVPKFNTLVNKLDADFALKSDVTDAVFESRSSDMTKAVYDTNSDGKVNAADDADKLGGELPAHYAAAASAFALYTHALKRYAVLAASTTCYNDLDDLSDTGTTNAETRALITGTQTAGGSEYTIVMIDASAAAVLTSDISSTERVHALTLSGGGDNIKFVAVADFEEGDGFEVNESSVTATATDGEPLSDGCFKSGAVVSCFKNGSTLNFKQGGAALGVKVVGGTTQPASPKENTIWVNTDTPITEWIFSAAQPTTKLDGSALSGGEVWFCVSNSCSAPVNILKKNGAYVYPNTCAQYTGGAWTAKPAETYTGAQWVSWWFMLYDNGNQYTQNGGAWSNEGYNPSNFWNFSAPTMADTYMELKVTSQGYYRCDVGKQTAVDLTNMATIKALIDVTTANGANFYIYIDQTKAKGSPIVIKVHAASGVQTDATVSADVSALSGLYYVWCMVSGYDKAGAARVKRVWGEYL